MKFSTLKSSHKFMLCLFFDGVGYLSFVIPLFDILWAPVSAYLMSKLFEGKQGKIASIIVFIEEALPITDVLPTFTLMWLYTTYKKDEKVTNR